MKNVSLEDFRKMITSRERRSLKRGFTENQKKFLKEVIEDPKKVHKTRCRELIIIPQIVGTKVAVHNGKEYVTIDVKPEMIGHRLGEYAHTRKKVEHSAPGFGATKSSKFVPLK
ncbi:MAG: 30S ribosomal protein S19 [Candidatus Aenigmatarchaeota archaeon]|nr:MAG: 30S ribosomal protein S19 [Candidatus Aenigmarchaeota archaeon]